MRPFLCPLLLVMVVSVHAACPSDWTAYEDKCYKFFNTYMTWEDAKDACGIAHPGGTLASIHSLTQDGFMLESVGYHYGWIGLRRTTTNGSWVWTDGSDTSFTYWYPCGEPYGDGERCAELHCIEIGMWCAYPCNDVDNEKPFFCQIDA